MAQRRAYLHVGLDDGSGDVVADALDRHAHALLDLRVRRAADPAETFRGVVEVLGCPAAWGVDPDEVEGSWSALISDVRRGRDTIVLTESLLAGVGTDGARTVVGALDGFDVHAVVTARAPGPGGGPELGDVLPRWAGAVGAAERVHVLLGDPATTWRALGLVAGFGTASLRVDGPCPPDRPLDPERAAAWRTALDAAPYDVVGDPDLLTVGDPAADLLAETGRELADARHELAVLRRRNDDLTRRLDRADRKRRKLKRRLRELA
ncbi:hypothetical protein [Nocardioides litoris]|uniref:hypothetical protein n=1 Tax=Nocardioides litoris TaxID=1926648 RepID=UPI001122BDFC|nr:hypothetical protein [Nocardioides litoris]